MRSGICPKCGSTRIAGPHNLHSSDDHLKIDLPGIRTATLLALTCMECGYTELYSDKYGLENIRSVGRVYRSSNPPMAKCPHCGAPIHPGETMCKECGYEF
ncbi:MAG: zinc ribbon domain-containing protein [Candidatus Thorarchaeota archaeon]